MRILKVKSEGRRATNNSTQSYSYYTETRTYNPRVQMTDLLVQTVGTASYEYQYVFPATANSRLVQEVVEKSSGTVSSDVLYPYDALNRLSTAQTAPGTPSGSQVGCSSATTGSGTGTIRR